MHFTSSLPVFYITLNALYQGAVAVSAASSVLDFRNLVIPADETSPVPLGDFGGIKFQNIEVVHMATQLLGTDSNEGVLADSNGLLHPTADAPSTTVAIIDPKTAPSGGEIIIPSGKRLQSLNFFCCSSKEGESILEGHQCQQVKCKATAASTGAGSGGKDATKTEGSAVAAPSSTATDTESGSISTSSLILDESASDSMVKGEHSVIVTFTGDGAVSRVKRGKRAATMNGNENMILVITDMTILPVDSTTTEGA
ncbi:hypothetical protein AOL_s00054g81 [Orbilia oligospora ATCC 24927]|uniref:Uncharacterized protein n=2 Tax=Orbilia oligospora TaxID=2813651 RepID=G1X5D7_ARTOA|nr:hypothetical protein AOL_s00054g81 [Orbilia oligospora ATCC 24927]EGX51682.1 hypothetical protein AOL_s00054g81 [Orbilia oligospora ATCC 24927]KAF3281619.1 hypothetical protein TWF970_002175 [Orbilia oligospora]